jgi:integrase
MRLPWPDPTVNDGDRSTPTGRAEPITVVELIDFYYTDCERVYGARRRGKTHLSRVRAALRPVKQLYGLTAASAFGPKALLLVRDAYMELHWSRSTVNERVSIVKAMFRWATRQEIVPPAVHHALTAVEGLRAGESTARESRKVRPVCDEDIDAVLPHVLPPVRAMIELQRLTGMRPGEVVIMRGCDLDTTGELWSYKPAFHKLEHRGIDRMVCLGKRAQAIVKPFLRTNLEEYLFRPDEADADQRKRWRGARWESHHRARAARRRKRGVHRQPTDHYTVTTYAQAIRRACVKAFPAPRPEDLKGDAVKAWQLDPGKELKRWTREHTWTPNRLRHSFATRIRKLYGVEASRVMLGHAHVATSEIYAERDAAVAATVAAKIG